MGGAIMTTTIDGSASADFATPLPISEGGTGASTAAAAAAAVAPIQMGTAQATTSGTVIDFSSIPAGVKRVTVNFSGVSTNGTNNVLLQLGDSGGIETSGYLGSAWSLSAALGVTDTTSFPVTASVAAGTIMHGTVIISLLDATSNTWSSFGNIAFSNSASAQVSGGSKSLSSTLDRVRITTSGGVNTFDAGVANIMWEF